MKQPTKRFLSLIAGVFFLVGSIVIYVQFIQPAYSDTQDVRAQMLSRQALLNSERSAIQQVQKLIKNYSSQGNLQQVISAAIPQSEDDAGALAQIYGLAQASGVAVQSISLSSLGNQQQVVYGPAAKKKQQTPLSRPLGYMKVNISASGSYEGLKSLISMLAMNMRIFDVQSLDIQPVLAKTKGVATSSVSYQYNLTAQTYYQLAN